MINWRKKREEKNILATNPPEADKLTRIKKREKQIEQKIAKKAKKKRNHKYTNDTKKKKTPLCETNTIACLLMMYIRRCHTSE